MAAAYMIMDGMWGSCGKGLLAGKLALDRDPDVVVCNFGPNAGHTFTFADGREVITRQLPTGIIAKGAQILIGPDAIINPGILAAEIAQFEQEYNISARLFIHERAGVVTQFDIDSEAEALRHIASTRKGVGSALSRKISRAPGTHARVAIESDALRPYVVSRAAYDDRLRAAAVIQIESAQGLELSLNHGTSYPTCTSRDVTPEAILNGVGIPRRMLAETIVVIRTFPIRVGNEYDETGKEIGNSGPVYADQCELSWADISQLAGRELVERTTVTKKVRRVFNWSWQQFDHMLFKLAPCDLFLNFVNYLGPDVNQLQDLGRHKNGLEFLDRVQMSAAEQRASIKFLGFGPRYDQVMEINTDE